MYNYTKKDILKMVEEETDGFECDGEIITKERYR